MADPRKATPQYIPESKTYLDREREQRDRGASRDPRRPLHILRDELYTRREGHTPEDSRTLLDKLLQIQLHNHQKEKVKNARETLVGTKEIKISPSPAIKETYKAYRYVFNEKTGTLDVVEYNAVVG